MTKIQLLSSFIIYGSQCCGSGSVRINLILDFRIRLRPYKKTAEKSEKNNLLQLFDYFYLKYMKKIVIKIFSLELIFNIYIVVSNILGNQKKEEIKKVVFFLF